jgi:hypothetical protein
LIRRQDRGDEIQAELGAVNFSACIHFVAEERVYSKRVDS